MRARKSMGIVLALSLLIAALPVARAAGAPDPQPADVGQTPPRLSFLDGQVSFWRPGAPDWAQAQVNTPLAAGDELYTASPGTLELQIGPRAFVRGWADTQLGLETQEPDFLQFKLTTGHAAIDLRTLEAGHTVEVDTPNAAITLDRPGYYRMDVAGDRTTVITRRGGRATVTPASGAAVDLAPSQEAVIEGSEAAQAGAYVAPPLDQWDQWNYARTDALLQTASARYVPAGTYGLSDLDRYGIWRDVPTYGPVWVPTGVPAGWVPYSTGSWIYDPYYGWTWVDTAPWGWTPYHYGRWVFVNGYWAWAPGPVVARPVYAPALVAFLGEPGASVSIGIAGPVLGWVALGWGEPCVPWWGRPGFVHRPWWGGWGGPRVVNNVVINRTTVVNVENITVYRNASVRNAVVAVPADRFGRGPITSERVTRIDVRSFHPMHTALPVGATPASLVPTVRPGPRPPENSLRRTVVATRPPHPWAGLAPERGRTAGPAGVSLPAPHIVSRPPLREHAEVSPGPPIAQRSVEHPQATQAQPPSPPRREGPARQERGPAGPPAVTRQAPPPAQHGPQVATTPPTIPPPIARRPEATRPPADRHEPEAPSKREAPRRAERAPGPPPPATPQPRPEAKPAGPPPIPPQSRANPGQPPEHSRRVALPPVTHAAPTPRPEPKVAVQPPATPPPLAHRPEPPRVATQPPLGGPPNHPAPNRPEVRPAARVERPAPSASAHPSSAPGNPSRDRPNG